VLVRDIPFHSLCEHNLLPFVGTAHVPPTCRRTGSSGLSKLARIVPSIQPRAAGAGAETQQIADWLQRELDPRGVGVVLEAEHMCMRLRGARVNRHVHRHERAARTVRDDGPPPAGEVPRAGAAPLADLGLEAVPEPSHG